METIKFMCYPNIGYIKRPFEVRYQFFSYVTIKF